MLQELVKEAAKLAPELLPPLLGMVKAAVRKDMDEAREQAALFMAKANKRAVKKALAYPFSALKAPVNLKPPAKPRR